MGKLRFVLMAGLVGAAAGGLTARAVGWMRRRERRLARRRQRGQGGADNGPAVIRADAASGFGRDRQMERDRGLGRPATARLGDEAAEAAAAPVRPIRYGGEAAEEDLADRDPSV